MAQTHDHVAALSLQRIHLLLGALHQLVAGEEGNALDLGGVGLGGCLRGVQAEHADLGAVGGGEGHVVLKGGLAVVEHVGRHDGELRLTGQSAEVLVAIVELVVAGRGQIIARQVHQLHGRCALAGADGGVALAEIAGIHEQHIGAHVLIGLFQGCGLGVAVDGAVHIVGVQDHHSAAEVIGRFRGRDRDAQGEHHGHDQEQRQNFPFHS